MQNAASTERSLNGAERQVLEAVASRRVADFSGLTDRRISAAFIQALMSGTNAEFPELNCPLRIRGAEIAGPMLAPSGGQLGIRRLALLFWSCEFDTPVDFSGAEFLTLRFVDCVLPAFIGAGLTIKADLDLSGSSLTGVTAHESELAEVGSCAMHLNNARIGGQLLMHSTARSRFSAKGTLRLESARIEGDVSLDGAELDGCGEKAVNAPSMVVGGNVKMALAHGHRCEVTGEVALVAAHITGDLSCNAARLINPSGRALHCEDLSVESVFLSGRTDEDIPFEANGRLNFLSATIGGSFFFSNARLAPGPDYGGLIRQGAPVTVNLRQLRVSDGLILNNIGALEGDDLPPSLKRPFKPVTGWFLLGGAQLGAIIDTIDTGWPEYGYLDLDGVSYQRIRSVDGSDVVSKRIAWLRRQFPHGQPTASSFRPQPYEELSRSLRQSGLTREANAIAVEKIRMRLAARVDGPWSRLFTRLLMLVSNHGYSSGKAVLAFLLFVLLGAVMYSIALWGFGQPFVPVEHEPSPVKYVFAFELWSVATERGCPGLDVFHYALDFAMPVIDLGQSLMCRFVPVGPARWLWLLLHSFYAITGAALSAIVILTLTGVLRRD